MNSFVVKISKTSIPINGKFIGHSEKDGKNIYVFRSHQVFKQMNSSLVKSKHVKDDFEILEGCKDGDKNTNGLRDEFDFKKNNICPHCGGLGAFYEIPFPKRDDKFKSAGVTYDEDGYVIFGENVNVYCICNDVTHDEKYNYIDSPIAGTYVGYMRHELFMATRNVEELSDFNTQMMSYAMNTSTCKTCHGHSETMYKHENCKECGLPGSRQFIMGG